MKKQSTSLFTQISIKQLVNLTTMVNETLAANWRAPKTRVFTTAELWNIQRQGKSRMHRRSSF